MCCMYNFFLVSPIFFLCNLWFSFWNFTCKCRKAKQQKNKIDERNTKITCYKEWKHYDNANKRHIQRWKQKHFDYFVFMLTSVCHHLICYWGGSHLLFCDILWKINDTIAINICFCLYSSFLIHDPRYELQSTCGAILL